MKQLDPTQCTKIGHYIYFLAQNLLNAKRQARLAKKACGNIISQFHLGVENEAHNRYYAAKEIFWEEIKKK